MNYNLNFEELNNNIEDEKDNESFENSIEEENNHMFPEKFKEDHIFTQIKKLNKKFKKQILLKLIIL